MLDSDCSRAPDQSMSAYRAGRRVVDREAAFVAFAQEALRTLDLDLLLQQACILVARGLDVAAIQVWELLPGANELLLRAGVGLPARLVGTTRIPTGGGSDAGYAVELAKPVSSDVLTEHRFAISDLVWHLGVRSTLNVPVCTSNDCFGAIGVGRVEDRSFTRRDVRFLVRAAGLLGAAIERQRSGTLVRKISGERETFLRELQHRVNNDLQVMASLLMFERRHARTPEARERLESVTSRMTALSLMHKRLCATGEAEEVDLSDYLAAICRDRLHLHGIEPDGPLKLSLELPPMPLDHERAVALGLIANEFITNTLKYAFPAGEGTITVRLRALGPGTGELLLADDGRGLPADDAKRPGGTGMQLIALLVRQAETEAEWSSSTAGTRLSLTFRCTGKQTLSRALLR